MGKQDYYQQQSLYDALDVEQQNDDDHLIEFQNLLFEGLLYNIRKVPFTDIINNRLHFDGAQFPGTIQSNSLHWFYTADRKMINDKRIYSFRFASPCNPDYYEAFIIENHRCFKLSNQTRHRLQGWYEYTGRKLPKTVENYLNISRIMNGQEPYETKIFVNNTHERLDIEFRFQYDYRQRLTITFEPGYPSLF